MNESSGVTALPFDDLVSVRDAARLLRVSESTVWRWINADAVPSYRVGRKRVYLKRSDLALLLRPARPKAGEMAEKERERLNLFPMAPRRPGVDPVAAAKALHAKFLAKRGREPIPEAWQDINEARDERTRELE